MQIYKMIPLSIKQTWVHYPNLGSPTSHGHNSLTVKSYVCSTYHQKWNDMYYQYIIVLPSNISKHIPLYMKQPWVHYPNLCDTGIRYQTFSKGWHQSLRVEINLQYHSPIFEINDNQQSIPIVHQTKPIVWFMLHGLPLFWPWTSCTYPYLLYNPIV
jgi:hypothetical protein